MVGWGFPLGGGVGVKVAGRLQPRRTCLAFSHGWPAGPRCAQVDRLQVKPGPATDRCLAQPVITLHHGTLSSSTSEQTHKGQEEER